MSTDTLTSRLLGIRLDATAFGAYISYRPIFCSAHLRHRSVGWMMRSWVIRSTLQNRHYWIANALRAVCRCARCFVLKVTFQLPVYRNIKEYKHPYSEYLQKSNAGLQYDTQNHTILQHGQAWRLVSAATIQNVTTVSTIIVTNQLVAQVEQSVGWVSACLTITIELNDVSSTQCMWHAGWLWPCL